ncbi:hypothetical protein VNO77_07697 [Canavalia gladiata]|uniref:Uncharacterized protein n=1 Tax=Canavalia gladiata TaxID=3824 RepID=A0AAN9MDD2_CANGL
MLPSKTERGQMKEKARPLVRTLSTTFLSKYPLVIAPPAGQMGHGNPKSCHELKQACTSSKPFIQAARAV